MKFKFQYALILTRRTRAPTIEIKILISTLCLNSVSAVMIEDLTHTTVNGTRLSGNLVFPVQQVVGSL